MRDKALRIRGVPACQIRTGRAAAPQVRRPVHGRRHRRFGGTRGDGLPADNEESERELVAIQSATTHGRKGATPWTR